MTQPEILAVFADASFEDAFAKIAPLFKEKSGCSLQLTFGQSGALRTDIEGLMPCDVFCSADEASPVALQKAVKAHELFAFAGNRLVVATRSERRFQNQDWADILCDPSTTIGMSTPRVSPEGDWSALLFKNIAKALPGRLGSRIVGQHAVALIGGNHTDEQLDRETGAHFMLSHEGIDAAVVFESAAERMKAEGLLLHPIPDGVCPKIVCWGCFPRTGKAPGSLKKELEALLLSPEGQTLLQGCGFLPAPANA
ncbi:MAG: substrate-binding domain-containing protein [Mesosutterella sp.]|nr:substrate-binding domain-containing protein [Mesosutterella sp.]